MEIIDKLGKLLMINRRLTKKRAVFKPKCPQKAMNVSRWINLKENPRLVNDNLNVH